MLPYQVDSDVHDNNQTTLDKVHRQPFCNKALSLSLFQNTLRQMFSSTVNRNRRLTYTVDIESPQDNEWHVLHLQIHALYDADCSIR